MRCPQQANPLVEQLRVHNNAHHAHRELRMTAADAWQLALDRGPHGPPRGSQVPLVALRLE